MQSPTQTEAGPKSSRWRKQRRSQKQVTMSSEKLLSILISSMEAAKAASLNKR